MSQFKCPLCKEFYNKEKGYHPIILSCACTTCSSCINKLKDIYKKEDIEIYCNKHCTNVKSLNAINECGYPTEGVLESENEIKTAPVIGEFQIFIKTLDGLNKFSIKVTKEMTIAQLKEKIQREQGYDKDKITLALRNELKNENTLEFYKITRTITITQIMKVIGGK